MIDLARLKFDFEKRYGRKPRIFRAPGRVNLIGEHTDYNEGFVLPAALDFATYVAAASRDDRRIRLASVIFGDEIEFDLDGAEPTAKVWARYVQGVATILEQEDFRLGGADLLIDSDVPVGAGLSSSAALEVSTAFALSTLSGHQVDGIRLAKISQTAEHEFAGVRSGIMDQFTSVFGKAGHALFLDCRSLDWSAVPLANTKFVICNTMTKHKLAESEYNKRRAECEAAAALLRADSLRDVSIKEFASRSAEMDSVLKKRVRHIMTENQRVLDSVDLLRAGDLITFGQLLTESHKSLRGDFEVSCRELDLMVDIASEHEDVLGARMTGGGFGGCTINLIATDDHFRFAADVSSSFESKTGIIPEVYVCSIGDGVCEMASEG